MSATMTFETIEADQQGRRRVVWAVLLAVLAYLVYAAISFDISGVIERAKSERAQALLADLVGYKIVIEKDNRSGDVRAAIANERKSILPEDPDWVARDGDAVIIDLEDGYSITLSPG
ncbi:MAG: hypothetical protein AAGG47_14530 [Pseudomonadota bacterium]